MQADKLESIVCTSAQEEDRWLCWTTESEEVIGDFSLFSVRRIDARNRIASPGRCKSFYTLAFSAWVNVIPLTADDEVVMVEQFRHGVQQLTLELPGGTMETEDAESLEAARRELLEETGYVSSDWTLIGTNHPNPAIQSNVCHTYLARNASFRAAPTFDESGTELIRTCLVPLEKIPSMIREGRITHALVLAAFHYLSLVEPTRI